ncbi:hypothetical protein EB001_09000 [bacterium]|nr:hypothetical protein [bacterium]
MNGLDCLNKLSSTMQQHWLKEISELDNPIDYLTSEYDEFDHFIQVFDWSESINGYSFWSEYLDKLNKEYESETSLNRNIYG